MSAAPSDLVFTPLLTALLVFEVAVLCTGLALLFRRRHDLRARLAGASLVRLAPAPHPLGEVALTAAFAIVGAVVAQTVAAHFARQWFPPAADGTPGLFDVVVGAGFQLGLLAGLAHAWFWHLRRRPDVATPDSPTEASLPPLRLSAPQAVYAGARAVVALLPVVWISALAWNGLLKALGVEAPPQDLVLIFMRTGDQGALVAMVFFAVVIAPVTEELLFRAGLFRWLRTRVPRAVALLLPAVLFSLLHFSWAALLPLAVLAVGFSLAFERSGHPLTPITAHALFNLNTLALLLVGFPA